MAYDIRTSNVPEQPVAVEQATLTVSEIGPWIGTAYGAVAGVLAAQGLQPAGPPFARYHQLGDELFQVEAGFPTPRPITPSGQVQPSTLPGGPVAETTHIGPYDGLRPAYEALHAWIAEQGGVPASDPWEVYYTDPNTQPDPSTWRTVVVQPYRNAGATG